MSQTALTRSVWTVDTADFPADGPIDEQARFLLRYAILAPSSHNAQPWRFDVRDDEIHVGADESRWLETADPDRRELYLSVGCAVENYCVAAEHFGFDPVVEYHDPDSADHVVTVRLREGEPTEPRPEALFDALTSRVTSHAVFDGRPLDAAIRERLAGLVGEDGVTLHLVDDSETRTAISQLQATADRRQMEDPAYRQELGYWIGLGALGSSWLAARVGQAVVTHLDIGDREAAKNSKLIQSAPVVAVLSTPTDGPIEQVTTGQVFERIALLASSEGVAVHPMSQTLERPEMRTRLRERLQTDERPQHLLRLGYVDETPEHTPRWPLDVFLGDTGVDPAETG